MNVNIPPHPTPPRVCVTAGAVPEAGTSLYIHIMCMCICIYIYMHMHMLRTSKTLEFFGRDSKISHERYNEPTHNTFKLITAYDCHDCYEEYNKTLAPPSKLLRSGKEANVCMVSKSRWLKGNPQESRKVTTTKIVAYIILYI